MCVPCAAPLLPEIGTILLIILAIIAGLVVGLWRAIPYVGMTIAGLSIAAWRWVTGAALGKPVGRTDNEHWDTEVRQGRPGPRFTRPVRATARMSLVAIGIGLLWNPLAVALIAGSLSVTVSGLALYGRRDRIITTCRALPRRTRELVRR